MQDRNIWVLDQILGYTGIGANDWEYDQFHEILARNSNGLPTFIKMSEKIEGTQTWVNVYRSEISYYNNDTIYLKSFTTQIATNMIKFLIGFS